MFDWNSVGMAVSHVGGVGSAKTESMISGRLPVTPAALAALSTAAPRGINIEDGMYEAMRADTAASNSGLGGVVVALLVGC